MELWKSHHPRSHRVLMNILTPGLEFVAIPDPVICKSPLPNRKIRIQSMRKTSFDEPHDSFDSNSARCTKGTASAVP